MEADGMGDGISAGRAPIGQCAKICVQTSTWAWLDWARKIVSRRSDHWALHVYVSTASKLCL